MWWKSFQICASLNPSKLLIFTAQLVTSTFLYNNIISSLDTIISSCYLFYWLEPEDCPIKCAALSYCTRNETFFDCLCHFGYTGNGRQCLGWYTLCIYNGSKERLLSLGIWLAKTICGVENKHLTTGPEGNYGIMLWDPCSYFIHYINWLRFQLG